MKKVKSNVVFILVLLLCLFTLLMATLFREKEESSYFENRALAAFPELTLNSLLDGEWFSDLETYLCDHAAGRTTITRESTAADIYLLHRPVVNDVVVTNHQLLLPFQAFEAVEESEILTAAANLANNLQQISTTVESYGGTYCYVAVPCQYAYFESAYPWYLNSRSQYTETSLAVLAEVLEEEHIHFLDLGEKYAEKGWPTKEASTVDNHFSIFGAYTAYCEILKYVNELSAQEEIPLISEEDISFTPIENYYMGSRTRKIFNLIQNDESLYMAIPKTEVKFERYDYEHESEATVYSNLAVWEPAAYTFYMGGDIANTAIVTHRSELPTVLLYGDSFTNAVECILYLSCDTMYSFDLRYYTEQTLCEAIEQIQPDYVICLRDYEALLSCEGNGGI